MNEPKVIQILGVPVRLLFAPKENPTAASAARAILKCAYLRRRERAV